MGVKPSATLNAMYIKAIKLILGVRHSAANDCCLIEAGYPSLEANVRHRQQKFFQRMKEERKDVSNDPLMFALELTQRDNPVMSRYLDKAMNEEGDII